MNPELQIGIYYNSGLIYDIEHDINKQILGGVLAYP